MNLIRTTLAPLMSLLTREDKIHGVWIICLLTLNAVLDFFSVAAFLPVIYMIAEPVALSAHQKLYQFYQTFGFTSTRSFLLLITAGVLALTVIRYVAASLITRKKAHYVFNVGSKLSARLMDRFIDTNYLQYTHLDYTAELNRIANHPIAFANNIIMPLAALLSEGVVLIMLMAFVAWYNFTVFFLLLAILAPLLLVYAANRKSLRATGTDIKETYAASLKNGLQLVEGLTDIKTADKQNFFKRKFTRLSDDLSGLFARDHAVQATTSRITELSAIGIICLVIVYSTMADQHYQQTIILLAVYAGVSFRIIPSFNRILHALLQLKTHQYLFAEFEGHGEVGGEDYDISTPETDVAISFRNKIEVQRVSFRYPDQDPILHNLSFTIHKGEKIAIMGKSGIGKTTLLLILLRLLKSDGKILLDGTDVDLISLKAWRKLIAYVPQHPHMLDATLAENIAFGATTIDVERINQIMIDLDMSQMVANLPNGISTQIGEKGIRLSGGQRQRVAIARALYTDAEILLLDEITSQLDQTTALEVIQTLQRVVLQKKTIVMITHHVALQPHFDTVLTFGTDRIMQKPIATIVSQN